MLVAMPSHAAGPMDACVHAYEQAQRLRKKGDLLGSEKELLACLYPRCPRVLRKDCKQWLQDVETDMPSFLVDAREPDGREAQVRVLLDGRPVPYTPGTAVRVNPGSHVFEVQVDGAPATTYRVTARPGEQGRRLHVVVARGVPMAVWALAGLGVAEAGAAAYFVLRGHGELRDCRPSCDDDDSNAVRVANTAAGVSAGMALLSFGAAGWLYWTRPRTTWSEPSGTRVVVRGTMVEVSGEF
jgi:hypothetical protein